MTFKEYLIKIREEYPPEQRWRVVPQDIPDGIVTANGSTYAVSKDGNISCMCVKKGGDEHGKDILKKAIERGGYKLQAFGKDLFRFYTKNGFTPVSWTKFDRKRSPEGWEERFGEEPLIFYAYTGNKQEFDYASFILFIIPKENEEDAYETRDLYINQQRKEKTI